jgi:hypothetical protein
MDNIAQISENSGGELQVGLTSCHQKLLIKILVRG